MKSISESFQKQLWYFVFSSLILLPIILGSCGKKSSSNDNTQIEEQAVDTLPDDFVVFFDRFHADSQFQMDHIIFPLEGLPSSTGDSDTVITQRFYWQRADWKKHNAFTDPSGQFEHWYSVLNERIIEHWINMKGTNLVMVRRFTKLDNGWNLIYYAGLRPHAEEEEEEEVNTE